MEKSKSFECPGITSQATLLMHAAYIFKIDIVKYVLKYETNINEVDQVNFIYFHIEEECRNSYHIFY
jgi:hypothetical protein